jgi:adenylate cyclase
VIGPSAPVLQDVHPTSTSGNGVMAGAEIQGNAVHTALRGFPLSSTSRWFDSLLIVLVGLIPSTVSLWLTPLRGVGISLVLAGLYAVGTQIAFNQGLILPFVYPVGALLLASAGAVSVHYLVAAFERERVRTVFARFVPEAVVNQVLAATDDDLRLGGVRRTCTLLFSDIRGFTTFAEGRTAEDVITILNRYLSAMTDAILAHGGTLVSYMGDGIMAVFGAPLEQPDHADRALAAACEMLDEQLPGFNEWMRSEGLGDGFRIGIGLNSGPVMAGNVGSEERLAYTTIGDVVNTASRIEGMTKGTRHMLFVAESTVSMLTREAPELVFVDEFDVRGRTGKIRIWSLASRAARAAHAQAIVAAEG